MDQPYSTSNRDGLGALGNRTGEPPPRTASTRYHALDGLRAAMMLLGIYLHVVVAYAPVGGWPYKPAEQTGALNLTLTFIHIFRMPIFYVMAGFFAALLYRRRGFRGAAANRIGRIVIPFVAGWLILFPLVMLMVGWRKFGLTLTLGGFASGAVLKYAHPLHLWFLEYLILFYGLAIVAVPAIAALPEAWRGALNRWFRTAVAASWGPALFAIPSFFALLPMHDVGLDDPPGFVPAPRIVIAYAIPFAFGWLLYGNADLLERLRQRAWTYALGAFVWCGVFLGAVALFFLGLIPRAAPATSQFFIGAACHSLALWFLIFAVTGLFLRYCGRYSARWRYLCDSSYFLYLAHMPVVIGFELLLEPVGLPPLVKIPLVLAATTLVLLVLYRYAVRPTAIGALLNGRRYSTASPTPLTAAA
jgi:hypothetical protein